MKQVRSWGRLCWKEIREGLSEEVTFKQSTGEREKTTECLGKSFPGRGNSEYKGPNI